MREAAFVAALFAVATLAGCLGDDASTTTGPGTEGLSPKQHAVLPPQEVWVPSAVDGKRMHNALYLPDVPEGTKVPVFVNFSPYWGDSAMQGGDNFARYMVDEYVPRGYAVVLSAVRGTGHSEGCFQIGGDLELQDARDVIDHFAAQPWSNGNVGAGGKSYDSTTQNGLIAKFPTPALKTVFHVSGITDMYRYNAKEGVPYRNGLTFNHWYWQQTFHEYGLEFPAGLPAPPAPVPVDKGEVWGGGSPDDAATPDDEGPESLSRLLDDVACAEYPEIEAAGLGTAATGVKDAYWQERDWTRHLPSSPWNGSVLFVHGLQDWNVKPDHLDRWLEAANAKGLAVKGWLHQDRFNAGHVYPMRADWNLTMLRWLDHYLKGVDTGIQHELGFEVQGSDGVWRHAPAWPPASTPFVLDPAGIAAGLEPDAPEAGRRFAGVPTVTVEVTTTNPDPVLRVALYDVGGGNETWINEAAFRPALKDDLSGPRAEPPGTATYTLTFFPMDHVVAPGHHLALELGMDPQRPASTPADIYATPAQLAGITYGSIQLTLPEVPLDGAVEPQPDPIPCFAC